MKKLSTFFGLFLMTGICYLSAQTVPNNGFESWTNVTTVNTWKSNSNSVNYIRQSTDKRSGNYAAQIVSSAADLSGSAGNISGILTLGNVNLTTQSVSGGIPISSKPTEFHGYYKYTAGNGGENMIVTVTMTKWTGSSRLTLANQTFASPVGQSITTYTLFSVPLTYNPTTITPDTFNITFRSSQASSAVLGTMLLIDDLAFTTATEVAESNTFMPSMWPNPANENVFINLNGEEYDITVINMIGQTVLLSKTNKEVTSIETSNLPIGIYYVNAENNLHKYSLKLLINR
jgi:hypothetical protein